MPLDFGSSLTVVAAETRNGELSPEARRVMAGSPTVICYLSQTRQSIAFPSFCSNRFHQKA